MFAPPSLDRIAVKVLDAWLRFSVDCADVPGVQVSIRKKGALIFSKAYGLANVDLGTPYRTKHVGHFASHSKMFTACATLQLHADGALNILDPIKKHLTWIKRHPDHRFNNMTIRDLLTHRSGISGNGLDSHFWDLECPFPFEKDLKKIVLKENLVYKPNFCTKYSNIGYGLLGLILQEATGFSYDQLLQKVIFKKLSAHSFLTDYAPNSKLQFADGYSRKFYQRKRFSFLHAPANALATATGLCANTEGTTRFVNDLYLNGKLIPSIFQKEITGFNWPVKNSNEEAYGYGTAFSTSKGNLYIGHSGSYPGFSSETRYLSGTDYVFGFIVNASERISFDAIKSMGTIIKCLSELFSEEELNSAIVSEPMMNWWGGAIYVVAKKKAVCFSLNGWTLGELPTILDQHANGTFFGKKMQGYSCVGEPIRFSIKGNKIQKVNFGAFVSVPYQKFLKKSKRVFIN